MTDSALSQQLNQWKTRLNTITNNLMDLYGAESTKAIRARLNDQLTGFSGVTKAKAARAIEVLDDLVQLYTRLANVIDEASDLLSVRKGSVPRDNEERAKELLYGQSIVMQTQHVVLSNRGLLDDGDREVRATPSQVLTNMEQSFAEARDGLSVIADALAHVQPRLAALGQKLTTLDGWAKTLGVARPAALADPSQPISRVASDPLGCANELDRLDAAVVRWRTELRALDAEHKDVYASIERGKAALAELRDLVARSTAAFAEAREKLAEPAGLVPPTGDEEKDVEALDAWLRTLEQNAAAGRFAAVKVGMAKWEQTCNAQLDAARASYARNSAGLDERADLRGRFRALNAKADALRSRGVALGEAAETASRQGTSVLDAIPFDLRAARRVVEAFEAALSAARK
jgi:hypothetical protein